MSLDTLLDGVHQAIASKTPLRLHGGDTKAFLGRPTAGTPLDPGPGAVSSAMTLRNW